MLLIRMVLFLKLVCFTLFSGLIYAQEADYELALQAYQNNKVNEAEIHLKNALKANPDNLPAKLLMAEVLNSKNQPHLAEQALRDASQQGVNYNL